MTSEQIRKNTHELYRIIAEAQQILADIRRDCPHDNFRVGLYEWRTGTLISGEICDDCGSFLRAVTMSDIFTVDQ